MHPEDELDALLDTRARNPMWSGHVSDEAAPLLTAAARLDPLREAMPDSAFAADLEARLMARMSRQPAPRPTPGAEAPAQRRPRLLQLSPRVAWAAVAATLLLTAGLGALSAKAAPGAPLYVVRQFAQTIASQALSAPTADPYSSLAQARTDLANYDNAITRANQSDALAALNRLRTDDAQTAQRIAAMSDTAARAAAQSKLTDFRQNAAADLRASLTMLTWQARAQVTAQLRTWGNTELVVTDVRISQDTTKNGNGQSNQGATGGATLLIEARGAGFEQGAQLLINGQPTGKIVSFTSTRLTVRVATTSVETGDAGELGIGVENPDGTVAITTHTQRDDHSAPEATGTPNSGDHNGDHSGSSNGSTEPAATENVSPTRTPTSNDTATETPTPSPKPGS